MSTQPELLPCPLCSGAMMFRKALHISDGNIDSIIHAAPTNCGLAEFSDGSIDESILAKWNTRAPAQTPLNPELRAVNLIASSSVDQAERLHTSSGRNETEKSGHQTLGYSPSAAQPQPSGEPVAAALARRLCQMFDSGGESQRSARARHASALFQMLNRDDPRFEAEQAKCDADPVGYLEACEGRHNPASAVPERVASSNEFEKYPDLAREIGRLAATGVTGSLVEWQRFTDALNAALVPQAAPDLAKENERLREALSRIERWRGEFPPTGKFWDNAKTEEMSYSACFGSNGERDYMRGVARAALASIPEERGGARS